MAGRESVTEKSCWVTLVTKPSYLPGVIILAHSLDKYHSKHPLVVQYTSSLGTEAIEALMSEAASDGRIEPHAVELLLPRKGQENTGSVAERFKDTFTKLRAFEVYKLGYTRTVFLDADMAVFRNPDDLFDSQLPGRDWLGANHACVCNLDKDPWAPKEWNKGNCAFTTVIEPKGIVTLMTPSSRQTYHLLNGGMFLFYPTEELWNRMMDYFNTTDKLKTYMFPDQNFLDDFFYNKWQPLSWKYNALKTMRYWHPAMWSDEELVILHYIVDKPWERKVSHNGIAGHLGRDGVTHQWWWDLYEEWLKDKSGPSPAGSIIDVMEKLINTREPFTEKVPLSQEPGTLEDVGPAE